MNFQLDNAIEFVNGEQTGRLGMILIRCNNVLWIGADKGEAGTNGDVEMS